MTTLCMADYVETQKPISAFAQHPLKLIRAAVEERCKFLKLDDLHTSEAVVAAQHDYSTRKQEGAEGIAVPIQTGKSAAERLARELAAQRRYSVSTPLDVA